MRWRVFAALELPPDNQKRLGEVLAGLQAAVPPGTVRWVRPEAMHLTVKFYGDIDQAQVPGVEAALTEAAANARPLRLRLEGLGVFPNPRRPQVIWAGLSGALEDLHKLQREVETLSAGLGYTPEGRAFKPHLTLGRVSGPMRPADHLRLLEALQARQAEVFGEFEAGRLSLMRSDLRPTGTVYTALHAAPLGSRTAQAAGEKHILETELIRPDKGGSLRTRNPWKLRGQ